MCDTNNNMANEISSNVNGNSGILYLDCGMGAAGDMLAASLYELLDEDKKTEFLELMNSLVPGKVSVSFRPELKCGILGTHFDVVIDGEEEHSVDYHEHGHCHEHTHKDHIHTHAHTQGEQHQHDHEHHHHHDQAHGHHHAQHSMADVENIINSFSGVSDEVKGSILEVYGVIADAESAVHGTAVSEIHFHEVGMMDAIIDVTAVCVLMDMLRPHKVYASPVRTGHGHMRCAHGILPVPAPATANILTGVPTYAGEIEAELCTPTGAALLKHFACEFRPQPVMITERIGYGMGIKDFPVCNCIRALYGSFAQTYKGHGTDRALIRGVSVGGGRVRIVRLNDIEVDFTGEYYTMIVGHQDKAGTIAFITKCFAGQKINIAALRLFREGKGEKAFAVIESDGLISEELKEEILQYKTVTSVDLIEI